MSEIIVRKCNSLKGEITIHGSKNAALPIIAASVMSSGTVKLKSVPKISDTDNMLGILSAIGINISRQDNELIINCENNIKTEIPDSLTGKLRGSILLTGPILAKFGNISISYPGGCSIGSRPIDLHLKGLKQLGAEAEIKNGRISLSADKLKGNIIYLDFPSVGATENIIMAACLAEGETIINNAATEPEIADLIKFLIDMGADIKGIGTETLKIAGKKDLKGAEYTIIPDRIEAGTYLTAVAACTGNLLLKNVRCDHISPVISKLKETGAFLEEYSDSIRITVDKRLKNTDIKTLPHPGFPTDMQAIFSALFSVGKGACIVTESIFENRFRHIDELKKMGANIKTEGRCAFIEGSDLSGAKVSSVDLRCGAGLTIAGLCASGETVVENFENILRGYESLPENLNHLGADIKIIK